MNEVELKARTRQLAVRIIKMAEALPTSTTGKVITHQIIRSGTSVGANYRAACIARSKAEFIAKIGISLEEADETAYWLELIEDVELLSTQKLAALKLEVQEICAILASTQKTARKQSQIANRK